MSQENCSSEQKQELPNLQNSSFENLRLIGKGAYCAVYACVDRETKEPLALKFIPQDKTKSICPTTIREIGLLKKLNHPNIIQMKEVQPTSNGLVMVFEYLTCDLKNIMINMKKMFHIYGYKNACLRY